mgnify:CR=1 FL=1
MNGSVVIIGIPKEIKDNEYRVSMTPPGASRLVAAGHSVLVEAGAGVGYSILDFEYEKVGARICTSPHLRSALMQLYKVASRQWHARR